MNRDRLPDVSKHLSPREIYHAFDVAIVLAIEQLVLADESAPISSAPSHDREYISDVASCRAVTLLFLAQTSKFRLRGEFVVKRVALDPQLRCHAGFWSNQFVLCAPTFVPSATVKA